jgi:hypothetical protein
MYVLSTFDMGLIMQFFMIVTLIFSSWELGPWSPLSASQLVLALPALLPVIYNMFDEKVGILVFFLMASYQLYSVLVNIHLLPVARMTA